MNSSMSISPLPSLSKYWNNSSHSCTKEQKRSVKGNCYIEHKQNEIMNLGKNNNASQIPYLCGLGFILWINTRENIQIMYR